MRAANGERVVAKIPETMPCAFFPGLDEGKPALGLRRHGSHDIVGIDECALVRRPVTAILSLTRQWMRDNGMADGFCRFLVVRCPDYTPDGAPRCLVECITTPGTDKQARAVAELGRILMAQAAVTGFCHSVRAAKTAVAYGEKVMLTMGNATVHEKFGHLLLEAPVQAFLQANTGAATLLYEQVRAYAATTKAETVWDIYCGVGAIGLFLAREGLAVRGVETVEQAVRYAKKNAAALSSSWPPAVSRDIAFVRGDVGEDTALRAAALASPPDLVITDPPRAGMSPALRNAIVRMRPASFIAVSCDAASLARDIAALSSVYHVVSARAVDCFPHTPHVEIVALLALSGR